LRCSQCGQEEAEYAVVDSEGIQVLCGGCFHEFTGLFGEIEPEWMMVSITGVGSETFIKTINNLLQYNENQYSRLLKEYSKLKKEREQDAKRLEDIKNWYFETKEVLWQTTTENVWEVLAEQLKRLLKSLREPGPEAKEGEAA